MGKKIEKEQAKRRPFWIILAVIGAAWLVWRGLFGYISYWSEFFLDEQVGAFKTFFDALIDVSAIYLVDFVAGCTFFTLMVKGLEKTSKPFAITGLIASVVTAVLYVFGIINAVKEYADANPYFSFQDKIRCYPLFQYIAYALILIGMAFFFIAAIKRKSMSKLSRVLIISGAILLMAIFAIEYFVDNGIHGVFKTNLCYFLSNTLYFCFSYIAIAISVF